MGTKVLIGSEEFTAGPLDIINNTFVWASMEPGCGLYTLFSDTSTTILYGYIDRGEWKVYTCPKFNTDAEIHEHEKNLIILYRKFGNWEDAFRCIGV